MELYRSFSVLGAYGKISCMSIGICVNHIEGEQVARQVKRNREWTQIVAMMDYKTVNRSDAKSGESGGFIRPIRPLRPLRAICLQWTALTAPAGHWSLITGHLLRVLRGAMKSNSCKSLISTIVSDISHVFFKIGGARQPAKRAALNLFRLRRAVIRLAAQL
jgi:hypothetical protein